MHKNNYFEQPSRKVPSQLRWFYGAIMYREPTLIDEAASGGYGVFRLHGQKCVITSLMTAHSFFDNDQEESMMTVEVCIPNSSTREECNRFANDIVEWAQARDYGGQVWQEVLDAAEV